VLPSVDAEQYEGRDAAGYRPPHHALSTPLACELRRSRIALMGSSPPRRLRAPVFEPETAAPMATYRRTRPPNLANVRNVSHRVPVCCPYRRRLTRPIAMRSSLEFAL